MPRLGGIHYRAMFRFSVPKDHAVIRVNLTPDFMPSARHEIGGSCGDAELPSFWCVCRTTAGATENKASCLSTGERLNRWPFACGKAHSRRLVFALPFTTVIRGTRQDMGIQFGLFNRMPKIIQHLAMVQRANG